MANYQRLGNFSLAPKARRERVRPSPRPFSRYVRSSERHYLYPSNISLRRFAGRFSESEAGRASDRGAVPVAVAPTRKFRFIRDHCAAFADLCSVSSHPARCRPFSHFSLPRLASSLSLFLPHAAPERRTVLFDVRRGWGCATYAWGTSLPFISATRDGTRS
jgi:hypothetical protein